MQTQGPGGPHCPSVTLGPSMHETLDARNPSPRPALWPLEPAAACAQQLRGDLELSGGPPPRAMGSIRVRREGRQHPKTARVSSCENKDMFPDVGGLKVQILA